MNYQRNYFIFPFMWRIVNNQQKCLDLRSVPSPLPKAAVSAIPVPVPLPSPLCLPDSTEDLCKPIHLDLTI